MCGRRRYSLWALWAIASVFRCLITLLDGGVAAALPIPNCPHLAQPYDAVLEALGALGAREAVSVVEPFLGHPTELVQYAAARAMYQLTGDVRVWRSPGCGAIG